MPPGVVSTNFTFSQLYRKKVETIRSLIRERVNVAQVDLYHRPITAAQPKPTKFPAIFVQPNTWTPTHVSTAKYDFWGEVLLYCYAGTGDPASAGQSAEQMIDALDKLFSNNALDDRLSAAPSRKYLVYIPPAPNQAAGWIESTFGPVTYSSILTFQRERSTVFLAAARATFRFRDVVVH